MGHDHGVVTAGGKHRARLAIALAIAAAVFLMELVGALVTGSLALLADAGHVFTDMFGVAFALVAATAAQRPPNYRRTFGWMRLEVIAAAFNAPAAHRGRRLRGHRSRQAADRPQPVEAGVMLAVAVVGMVANFVSLRILTAGKDESINVRGAYLEVLGDLLGSAAVVAAGAVIVLTGWGARRSGGRPGVAAPILPVRCAAARRTADPHGGGARRPRCRRRAHALGRGARVVDVHDVHVDHHQASRRSPHTSLWIAQRSTSADRRRCWISCRGARNVVSTSSTRRSRWNRPTMPGMNRGARRTVAGYRGGTVPVAPASPPWSSWIARWPGSCPLTRKERAIRQPTGHPATSRLFGPHRA